MAARVLVCIGVVLFANQAFAADVSSLVARAEREFAVWESDQSWPAGRVIVVGVLNADGTRWFRSAGSFEPDTYGAGSTATEHTLFEIGSITKTVVGTALAQMVEEGVLRLDDTVGSFVPPPTVLDPSVANITLAQLATHTSGLPRIARSRQLKGLFSMTPYGSSRETLDWDLSILTVTPSSGPEYSNMGAGLLGDIMSRVSAKDLEDVLKDRVMTPLKMPDTVVRLSDDQQARFAPGYFGLSVAKPWSNMGTGTGAGGLRSTAADLLTYAAAVIAAPAGPLGRAFENAIVPRVRYSSQPAEVGLFWHVRRSPEAEKPARPTIVYHNGATYSHISALFINRAEKQAVVVLVNGIRQKQLPRPSLVAERILGL